MKNLIALLFGVLMMTACTSSKTTSVSSSNTSITPKTTATKTSIETAKPIKIDPSRVKVLSVKKSRAVLSVPASKEKLEIKR